MKLTVFIPLISLSLFGQSLYLNTFMSHLHKEPSLSSSSLTAIQCGHRLKLMKTKKTFDSWSYVQVGEDKGFVQNSLLVAQRPECFQAKYNELYLSLNLDVSDLYYFGRLDEVFINVKSKAKTQ